MIAEGCEVMRCNTLNSEGCMRFALLNSGCKQLSCAANSKCLVVACHCA